MKYAPRTSKATSLTTLGIPSVTIARTLPGGGSRRYGHAHPAPKPATTTDATVAGATDAERDVQWGSELATLDASAGRLGPVLDKIPPSPQRPGGGGLSPIGDLSNYVTRLADVEREVVPWIWPGRIPLGKLAILDGDPGVGKSSIITDIAARITTGREMPDGTTGDLEGPAGVLYLSYEDCAGDTIRPRAEAAGADLERFLILDPLPDGAGGERPARIPTDLPSIEQIIRAYDIKLVIIDPVMAALDEKVDSNKDQRTRAALTPLTAMAERTGCAILLVRHLNKDADKIALYRGGGSIGIVGTARVGMVAVKHPDDPSLRLLATTKCNLAEEAPTLGYYIESLDDGGSKVVWGEEVTLTADEALASVVGIGASGETERERAMVFLTKLLTEGQLPATLVYRVAEAAGFSERTVQRAKKDLGVEPIKVGFGKDGQWHWSLRASEAPSHSTEEGGGGEGGGPKTATTPKAATLGEETGPGALVGVGMGVCDDPPPSPLPLSPAEGTRQSEQKQTTDPTSHAHDCDDPEDSWGDDWDDDDFDFDFEKG